MKCHEGTVILPFDLSLRRNISMAALQKANYGFLRTIILLFLLSCALSNCQADDLSTSRKSTTLPQTSFPCALPSPPPPPFFLSFLLPHTLILQSSSFHVILESAGDLFPHLVETASHNDDHHCDIANDPHKAHDGMQQHEQRVHIN